MDTKAESTKNKLRDALGVIHDLPVAMIYYESATQFEFLALLPQIAEAYYKLLIVPASTIAERQLKTIIGGFIRNSGAIITDLSFADAADAILAFRYSPALQGMQVQILDPLGRWLSQELAS